MTSRYAVEQASEGANSHRKKRKWKCPDVDMSVTRSSAVKLEDLQSDCAHLAAAPSTERQVCWPVFSVPWRFHECQVLLSLFGVKVPSLRRSSGTRNARTQRREANTVRAPPLIRTTAAPAPAYARPRPRPRHTHDRGPGPGIVRLFVSASCESSTALCLVPLLQRGRRHWVT